MLHAGASARSLVPAALAEPGTRHAQALVLASSNAGILCTIELLARMHMRIALYTACP